MNTQEKLAEIGEAVVSFVGLVMLLFGCGVALYFVCRFVGRI